MRRTTAIPASSRSATSAQADRSGSGKAGSTCGRRGTGAEPFLLWLDGAPAQAAAAWAELGRSYSQALALADADTEDALALSYGPFDPFGTTAVAAVIRDRIRQTGGRVPRARGAARAPTQAGSATGIRGAAHPRWRTGQR